MGLRDAGQDKLHHRMEVRRFQHKISNYNFLQIRGRARRQECAEDGERDEEAGNPHGLHEGRRLRTAPPHSDEAENSRYSRQRREVPFPRMLGGRLQVRVDDVGLLPAVAQEIRRSPPQHGYPLPHRAVL